MPPDPPRPGTNVDDGIVTLDTPRQTTAARGSSAAAAVPAGATVATGAARRRAAAIILTRSPPPYGTASAAVAAEVLARSTPCRRLDRLVSPAFATTIADLRA